MTYEDIAIKYAGRSSIKRHKTGAVLVTRKDTVVYGWSHVSQLRLKSAEYSMHAELHCILRARNLDLREGHIYIATLAGKSGNVVTSYPCDVCKAALYASGIYDVHYSVTGGGWLYADIYSDFS